MAAHPHCLRTTPFVRAPAKAMDAISQRQEHLDDSLSLLNVAIEAMNLTKEASSMTPAKAVFGTVSVLLTMIRVRFLPFSDTLS